MVQTEYHGHAGCDHSHEEPGFTKHQKRLSNHSGESTVERSHDGGNNEKVVICNFGDGARLSPTDAAPCWTFLIIILHAQACETERFRKRIVPSVSRRGWECLHNCRRAIPLYGVPICTRANRKACVHFAGHRLEHVHHFDTARQNRRVHNFQVRSTYRA